MNAERAAELQAETERAKTLFVEGQRSTAEAILLSVVDEIGSALHSPSDNTEAQPARLLQSLLECSEAVAQVDASHPISAALQGAARRLGLSTNDPGIISRVMHGVGIIALRSGRASDAGEALEEAANAARAFDQSEYLFLLEMTVTAMLQSADSERSLRLSEAYVNAVCSSQEAGRRAEVVAYLFRGHALRRVGELQSCLVAYERAHAVAKETFTGERAVLEIETSIKEVYDMLSENRALRTG